MSDQGRPIGDVFTREQSRLRNFIRRRVRDTEDAEDILQDVFSELLEANRLLVPIDHISAWLFRVARNRITDLFRRKKPEALEFEELLPSIEAGPDARYVRQVLFDALATAIEELPEDQRRVFIAHELEGKSFKDIAADTGANVNTLLSRKRYAVLRLRERLQKVYDDLDE